MIVYYIKCMSIKATRPTIGRIKKSINKTVTKTEAHQ